MLRKSLTVATVVGAGSQAVAAGFRHAMSTPRIPSSRSEEKVFGNIDTCRNSDR